MPVPARSLRAVGASVIIAAALMVGAACSSPTASPSRPEPGGGLSADHDDGARSGAAGAAGDGLARNQSPGLKQLSGDAVRTQPAGDD